MGVALMSALADYLDLRFAVADHAGNRNISDVMPRLVQMAESYLNKELRCRQMITATTLTLTDGVAFLPVDFLEILHVFGLCGYRMRASSLADAKRPGSMWSKYSIDGISLYINGFSGDRDIEYYAKLPTLTASPTASNWLLEEAPDVYLYAVSLEAAKFLKDVDLAQATKTLLDSAMKELRVGDERARWANSVVRVQGLTP
jgi:hypothetical protein